MTPTIGRIVHYTLTEQDANTILAQRQRAAGDGPSSNPVGNYARAGDTYPAVVVRVFGGDAANLQVLLDGTDTYWATSRTEGELPGKWGQWSWPPRV